MTLMFPLAHRSLMGVDGSESSLTALHRDGPQAEATSSSLRAVTVWEWERSLRADRGTPLWWASGPASDTAGVLDQGGDVRRAHPGVVGLPGGIEGHLVGGIVIGLLRGHFLAKSHCPIVTVREDPNAQESGVLGDLTPCANTGSTA
jgi:hypothetical protein